MFSSANSLVRHSAQTDGITELFTKPRRAKTGEHAEPRANLAQDDQAYHESSTSQWPYVLSTDRRVKSDLATYDEMVSSDDGLYSINTTINFDPRVDSDLGHRGPVTGSTNSGPHSTDLANKKDARFDTDQDQRGTYTRHGSTNYEPHSTNLADRLDPRYNFDQDSCGAGNYDAGYTSQGPVHRSSTMNKLDPRVDSEYGK